LASGARSGRVSVASRMPCLGPGRRPAPCPAPHKGRAGSLPAGRLGGAGSPETARAGAFKAGTPYPAVPALSPQRTKDGADKEEIPLACERSCSAFWLNAPATWRPRPSPCPSASPRLPGAGAPRPQCRRQRHPAGGTPCGALSLIREARARGHGQHPLDHQLARAGR